MPGYEKKDMEGVLFRNERKENANHPDYTGTITFGGEEFWLSAWINEAKQGARAGQKYMKIKVNPKEDRQPRSVYNGPADLDDDIPF